MICGVLLAAGGATRFGSQKLVASFRGVPLVRHAALTLRASCDAALVVVGNEAAQVRDALRGVGVTLADNPDWASGLASSLRAAVAAMAPEVEAIVVMLGDQPGVEPSVIDAAIARWRADRPAIVAVRYAGVQDHPVLFDRAVFDELLELRGDTGAKPVIQRDPARVAFVDVEHAAPRDVDTGDDLDALDA